MLSINRVKPEAYDEERKEIIKAHEEYTKVLLYFLGNDQRNHEHVRSEMLRWGYPKDEDTDNGNW